MLNIVRTFIIVVVTVILLVSAYFSLGLGGQKQVSQAQSQPAQTQQPDPEKSPIKIVQTRANVLTAINGQPADKWINTIGLQAQVDVLTIKSVVMNRGNCQINSGLTAHSVLDLPLELHFGEVVPLVPSCEPLELEVKTDAGDWTWKW